MKRISPKTLETGGLVLSMAWIQPFRHPCLVPSLQPGFIPC